MEDSIMSFLKRLVVTMLTILVITTGVAGCTQQSTSKTNSDHATIVLIVNHKQVAKKHVVVVKKETIIKALRSKFKVKTTKGFITSINGHTQNTRKNKYWMYKVNGKTASKGADATTIHKGDKVAFTLNAQK